MWERLAFYLLLGILVLYATDSERGGLGLSVGLAAEIYGTYLAFVYFTPFLGGMIADRYLGYRKAIALGGFLMAGGLFCLGIRSMGTFYAGLTLLCVGNGLFKPNISAMVGNLYEPGDPKRDAGFNIFYMGINIGACLSAILAAPLRNIWDFNIAFVAAGIGLLIGVGVLLFNWKKLAVADRRPEPDPDEVSFGRICLIILLPAAVFGAIGYFIGSNVPAIANSIGSVTFAFIVGMLPILSYFAIIIRRSSAEEKPGLKALIPVYVAGGAFFMILHLSGGLLTFFTENNTNRPGGWVPDFVEQYYCQKSMPSYYTNATSEIPRPDEDTLLKVDQKIETMFGAKRITEGALNQVVTQYPDVSIVAEGDAGWNDEWGYLACGVFPDDKVKVKEEKDAHGLTTVSVSVPETEKPSREVVMIREKDGEVFPVLLLTQKGYEKVYAGASEERLKKGESISLVNAELIVGFLNPAFVVLLTPLVVAFFAWRVRRKKAVTTARKIFLGMIITVISLIVMAIASHVGGDGAVKTSAMWLVVYYLIITIGELCLSPMGLSLVTKLSPKRLVGLMMGGWFLSTAIGNKMSGFISGLDATTTMFTILGVAILVVAAFIFVLLPKLDAAIKKYGA